MKALQWLWPEDDLMVELEDMLAERESTQGEVAKTVKEALTSRSVRWQILTLVFPCAGVQFCGIPAVRSGLNTVADSISLVSTTASSFPAVFLHLWHLPWDRRARGPDAIPGLRCWSNRASSSYSMCKCLHKWSKRGTTKTFGGASILSSLQSCRKLTHMRRCYRMKSSEELGELYWTHFPFFSAASQSFLIDHAGRKKLMGCSYLLMGVIMSVLTATLSLKVKVLKQEFCFVCFFYLREQILKFRHFCTAPSSLDPLSEHCPDLFCHLGVWSRTRWIINCFFTSEEKRLADILSPLWVYSVIFQLVCPLLSLLTSSYKPGDLLHTWSAEPSTGWACSFWDWCSAILWWETPLLFIIYGCLALAGDFTDFALTFSLWSPPFLSRMALANSASWFLWLTPSPVVCLCCGLSRRPKEGQWWR